MPHYIPPASYTEIGRILDEVVGPLEPGDRANFQTKRNRDRSYYRVPLIEAAHFLESNHKFIDPKDWYKRAFNEAASVLGLSWLARTLGAWVLKKAVRLLVEWFMEQYLTESNPTVSD